MEVITLTKENFKQEVINSDKPVLVDFWASWCGPCRMVSPIVDEIAKETDSVKVCKLNVDEEQAIAQDYGVMSIPTLMLFKDGEVAKTSVGARPKSEILAFING